MATLLSLGATKEHREQALFLVFPYPEEEKKGGLHPILDPRRLNKYILCLTFRIVLLASIIQSLQVQDWFMTVNLQDLYFNIAILPHFHTNTWCRNSDSDNQAHCVPSRIITSKSRYMGIASPAQTSDQQGT